MSKRSRRLQQWVMVIHGCCLIVQTLYSFSRRLVQALLAINPRWTAIDAPPHSEAGFRNAANAVYAPAATLCTCAEQRTQPREQGTQLISQERKSSGGVGTREAAR